MNEKLNLDLREIKQKPIWDYIIKRIKSFEDHIIWNRGLGSPSVRISYVPANTKKKRYLTFETILRYEFDINDDFAIRRTCNYSSCVNPEHYEIVDKSTTRRNYTKSYYLDKDNNVFRKGHRICRVENIPNHDAKSIRFRPILFDKKGKSIVVEPMSQYSKALRMVMNNRGENKKVYAAIQFSRKEYSNSAIARRRRNLLMEQNNEQSI